MKYYVAPLEGITGYVMRNVHHKYYPGADKYFIPFIEPKPKSKKIFTGRELKDILPENNSGMNVVPQILTNKWEDFLWTAGHLQEYGYREVNLNLGCPSRTVVSKKRGSGFLAFPKEIDEFLYNIFEKTDMRISVKTRLGKEEPEEFEELMEIYNRYPLEELIIHPRTQRQLYGGVPEYSFYGEALEKAKFPVCYNGDIKTAEDCSRICSEFSGTDAVMMGRGILRNPALICEIRGQFMNRKQLIAYHGELLEGYTREIPGEVQVLFKMKELWCFMMNYFETSEKQAKAVMKAKNLCDYERAASEILGNCRMKEN